MVLSWEGFHSLPLRKTSRATTTRRSTTPAFVFQLKLTIREDKKHCLSQSTKLWLDDWGVFLHPRTSPLLFSFRVWIQLSWVFLWQAASPRQTYCSASTARPAGQRAFHNNQHGFFTSQLWSTGERLWISHKDTSTLLSMHFPVRD